MNFTFRFILIICLTFANYNLFGQFYYFEANADTCYGNDFYILGVTSFDTLTVVVPPKSYKIQPRRKNDYMLEMRRYNYACEKRNAKKLTSLRKDEYLYSLFNDDVYILASFPHVYYNDFIIHCADDSLKKIIEKNATKYYQSFPYYNLYTFNNFKCIDYKHQCYLLVLMNANFFNRIVIGYNFCPAGYLLTEFNENVTKGLYVKVLLPFFPD